MAAGIRKVPDQIASSTNLSATKQALDVAILDGAGAQITTFGGGTEYTEGNVDTTITGTAIMWEDTGDTLRAVSAAKPLPVNIVSGGAGTSIADGAVFTPDTTSLTPIGGYRDDTAPATVTEGDAASVRITENRAIHVNLRDAGGTELAVGGGTQYTEDAVAVANPVGNALNLIRDDARAGGLVTLDGDNVAARGTNAGELYVKHVDAITVSAHAVTNAGTFAVQVDGNALTALQKIDDPVLVDDAAFTPATSSVMMAGFEADETAADSVDEGDAGAARMTLDRKVIVTVQPHTAGGWDTFMATSGDSSTALTNTAQAIKASAGKLGGWYIYNPNSAATYVILYNVASGSVTVGTTVAKMILCIPATAGANLDMTSGITFDTAISVAATTTGPGNTAPSTALEANFWYK